MRRRVRPPSRHLRPSAARQPGGCEQQDHDLDRPENQDQPPRRLASLRRLESDPQGPSIPTEPILDGHPDLHERRASPSVRRPRTRTSWVSHVRFASVRSAPIWQSTWPSHSCSPWAWLPAPRATVAPLRLRARRRRTRWSGWISTVRCPRRPPWGPAATRIATRDPRRSGLARAGRRRRWFRTSTGCCSLPRFAGCGTGIDVDLVLARESHARRWIVLEEDPPAGADTPGSGEINLVVSLHRVGGAGVMGTVECRPDFDHLGNPRCFGKLFKY
jgi:hypothetical protein